MATFGKTTDGAGQSASSAPRVWVSQASPAETGSVTTGHARCNLSAAGSTTARFAIYANDGGVPGALLAVSDTITISDTTPQWRTFTFSGVNVITITAGTTYFIGPAWADPGTPSLQVWRDSVDFQRWEQAAASFPALPDPFGTATANNTGPIDAYVTYSTAPTQVEKTGSDFGTGAESGGVTATATGSDAATGSESGSLALSGDDAGTGTESGYVAEGRDGGDAGAGTEAGDSSATVTSGESATGAEAGGTTAEITTGPDTATGTELGHIAIPGEDTAVGTDALSPPLQATLTSGEAATGTEGGYVETLYGDLVVSLYAIHPDTGALVALPHFVDLSFSRLRNSRGDISLSYPVTGQNFDLLRSTITADRDLEIEIWTSGTRVGALRGYLQQAAGDDTAETGVWEFAGGFLELRMSEAVVWPQPIVEAPPGPVDAAILIRERMQSGDPILNDWTWAGCPAIVTQYNDLLLSEWQADGSPAAVGWLGEYIAANQVNGNGRGELAFAAVNPGVVGRILLDQAQARGTLSDITRGFTDEVDSAGVQWPNVVTTKFSPGASYVQVLDKLVDLGMLEWAIEWTGTERQLRIWSVGGRGTDRTLGPRPVIMRRGRNLLDAPRKWSVRESGTAVLAAGSEGVYEVAVDPSAEARRGRRIEVSASAGNLETSGAVRAFAQAQLQATTPGMQAVSHDIGMLPGEPRPIIAFDIGDWIYSQTTTALERLRVVQWSLRIANEQGGQSLSGTVVLNDTVQNTLERLQRRLNALTAGETVVGTSQPPSEDDVMAPAAPTGVVATSEAYYDVEGTGYAAVVATWTEVTTNADGSVTDDIAGYQVRWRYNDVPGYPSGWNELPALPGAPGRDWSPVAVGVDVQVQVAAFDQSNNFSAWSAGYIFTTAIDDTPPGIPSAPVVTSALSVVKIAWDGLDVDGGPMPPDLRWVEVHVSTASNFTPSAATLHDFMYGAQTAVFTGGEFGVTYFARLVAVDRTDNRSAPSAQGSAVAAGITLPEMGPDAVGSAQFVEASILSAHIGEAQISSVHVNEINAGLISTGTMNADVTVSGSLRTASTGARWMADAMGMRLYNAANALTVDLRSQTGTAFISGQIQSALTGTRMMINPGGTSPDQMRFYPNSGAAYGKIETRTFNNQALIDILGGTTRTDGATGQVGAHPLEGYIRWGLPEATTPNSYAVARNNHFDLVAPFIFITPQEGISPPSGVGTEIHLGVRRSDGSLRSTSRLVFQLNPDDQPWFNAPNPGIGIVFQSHAVLGVVNGVGNSASIEADDFINLSSQEQKEQIRDVRAVLDPKQVVRQARARAFKMVKDRWYHPPATPEDPNPEPIPVPEEERPLRVGLLAEELPEQLQRPMKMGDGTPTMGVSLSAQVATIWGAFNQLLDQEIRTVVGRTTVTSGPHLPGGVIELPIAWDETPLEVPTGGVVVVQPAIQWLGRTTAVIKPGSLTETGCTIEVRVLAAINPSTNNAITYEAQGLYLYTPPFEPEEA